MWLQKAAKIPPNEGHRIGGEEETLATGVCFWHHQKKWAPFNFRLHRELPKILGVT